MKHIDLVIHFDDLKMGYRLFNVFLKSNDVTQARNDGKNFLISAVTFRF